VEVAGPHGPTIAVRRAAYSCAVACGLFWALVVLTTQAAGVHDRSPWAGDPYAGLVWLAALLTPVLVAPTLLRAVVHGGPVPAPPHAVRTIVAGSLAALVVLGVGLAVCVIAVVSGAGSLSGDAAGVAVLLLLVAGAGALTLAGQLLQHAHQLWAPQLSRLHRDAGSAATGRPDLLDDVATLSATLWPGSGQARLADWLDRGLDDWAWSPRRHRTVFVGAAAVVTGGCWTGWHALVDGPWDDLASPLLFALVTGTVVAAALAGGITWLGLLRAAPGSAR
jgi:hypothetical protein